MRSRIHALVLLAALALLQTSQATHAHPAGASLDAPCGVCALQTQARAAAPAPVLAPPPSPAIALALAARDPVLRGAPRGPPLGA